MDLKDILKSQSKRRPRIQTQKTDLEWLLHCLIRPCRSHFKWLSDSRKSQRAIGSFWMGPFELVNRSSPASRPWSRDVWFWQRVRQSSAVSARFDAHLAPLFIMSLFWIRAPGIFVVVLLGLDDQVRQDPFTAFPAPLTCISPRADRRPGVSTAAFKESKASISVLVVCRVFDSVVGSWHNL